MKVVGSITTIPARLSKLEPILNHLLELPLDKIHVNIPDLSSRGEPYIISEKLSNYIDSEPRLKLNRGLDYGPITKLIPALIEENDPETRIITFDDDMIPKRNLVNILLTGSQKYPNSAIGISGTSWGKFPFNFQRTERTLDDCQVDWLEGVHSILYIRKFFNVTDLLNFRPKCLEEDLFYNDDHWISAYLAKNGIPRWSIGYSARYCFQETSTKKIQALSNRKLKLVQEHARIISYYSKLGLYHEHHPKHSRIIYVVLIILIIFFIWIWWINF